MPEKRPLPVTVLTVAAVIVGGIWASIQIYDRFFPSGAKLAASVTFNEWKIPPDIGMQLESYRMVLSPLEGRSKFEERVGPLGLEKEKLTDLLATIQKLGADTVTPAFKFGIPRYSFSAVFRIQNTGSKEARDIVLDVPQVALYSTGVYRFSDQNSVLRFDRFSGSIPLSNLRPGRSTEVEVWTDTAGSAGRFENARISYADGVIAVSVRPQWWHLLGVWVTSSGWRSLLAMITVCLLPWLILPRSWANLPVAIPGLFVTLPSKAAVPNNPREPDGVSDSPSAKTGEEPKS